ncbi:hypothetical protein [Celeribacter baekdonensis]|uniref:hypothetical protein n=1 Tax=Celeribacter baekdonensis TaxID=875171 RepID=UPI003A908BFC
MAEKNSLSGWLGFAASPNWLKSQALGGFLGFALVIIVLVVGVAGVLGLAKALILYVTQGDESGGPSAAARNIGLLLAAAFGAPFVAWQAIVRQKQADVAEQIHITEVLAKAVENLGAEKTVKRIVAGNTVEKSVPVLEVRSGGLLALERLAKENLDFHVQVMEIVSGYIRHNAQAFSEYCTDSGKKKPYRLRDDLRTAFNILLRRTSEQITCEQENDYRVSLSGTSFFGFDMPHGEYNRIDFSKSDFCETHITWSKFMDCRISFCEFSNSHIFRVYFEDAPVHSFFEDAYLNSVSNKIPEMLLSSNIWTNTLFRNMEISDRSGLGMGRVSKFDNCAFYNEIFKGQTQKHMEGLVFMQCDLSKTGVTTESLMRTLGCRSVALPAGQNAPNHWLQTPYFTDQDVTAWTADHQIGTS